MSLAGGGAATGRRERAAAVVSVAALAVPFAVLVLRLLFASGRVDLPDDLALIDLHTRQALHFRQQLGPFDRFGWNHPGPSYFYLLSLAYRVLGSGAKAAFVGAVVINAAAALAVVGLVRRRAGDRAGCWAAAVTGALLVMLSFTGPAATTYSEGPLGALASPWNPVAVLVPTVLVAVLAASAAAGSGLSALAAAVVASLCVQTDVSTAPLVALFLVVGAAGWALGRWRWRAEGPRGRPGPGRLALLAVAGGVLVAMWVPPLVQEVTGHPANLTLLWDFFTTSHPGQPLHFAWWATVTAEGVVFTGTGGVMGAILGLPPAHETAALAALAAGLAAAAVATWRGMVGRSPFAASLGAAGVLGVPVTVVAATHVTGYLFGYLLIWAVAVPTVSALALASVPAGSWPRHRGPGAWRLGLATAVVAAVAAGAGLTVRAVSLPPLRAADDPVVTRATTLVTRALGATGGPVFVGDNDANLIDTEEFIGLVNRLDQLGDRPRVNRFWRVQFGPGYVAADDLPVDVELYRWTPTAPSMPGYVGRAGHLAITVRHR